MARCTSWRRRSATRSPRAGSSEMARSPSSPRDLVAEALAAKRASRRIEFKGEFSPETPGSWCELVKDIVAIANSGGGVIVVGVDDAGCPTGWDPAPLLSLDPAEVVNAIAQHVGEQLDELEIAEAEKGGRRLAIVAVGTRTGSPLVFEKPGTYIDEAGHQKTAFDRGTVYFRHGAKTELARTRDLARF